MSVWREFKKSCEETGRQGVCCTKFIDLWQQFHPNVVVAKPMSDFDLLTRDEDALSRMQELFPVSPVVPPTEPSQPAHINNSSTPVTEDLVHSCVTPQKVQRVHETRQSETDRYKCAIKLLPNFFTPAELVMSNTDGNFGKQPLDKTKLHTLKGNLYQLSLVRYGHGRLKGTFFCNNGFHKWWES